MTCVNDPLLEICGTDAFSGALTAAESGSTAAAAAASVAALVAFAAEFLPTGVFVSSSPPSTDAPLSTASPLSPSAGGLLPSPSVVRSTALSGSDELAAGSTTGLEVDGSDEDPLPSPELPFPKPLPVALLASAAKATPANERPVSASTKKPNEIAAAKAAPHKVKFRMNPLKRIKTLSKFPHSKVVNYFACKCSFARETRKVAIYHAARE
ncbi:hypothetical protein [Rhizobium leguminosarum]